jgi:hypothetical protein
MSEQSVPEVRADWMRLLDRVGLDLQLETFGGVSRLEEVI